MLDIAVFNPLADMETSFGDLRFTHTGCAPMLCRRDVISSDYTINCSCGLTISMLRYGPGYNAILNVITTGVSVELPQDGYSANTDERIQIVESAT